MSIRKGDRGQTTFLPASLEDYVTESDPVRVYDQFVEMLDLKELGLDTNPYRTGNPRYDPKTMLKILLYGYSYGWRSSRKLERALYHNIAFIWLAGGLKPDHKTIANFRRNNIKAIKGVMKQMVRVCLTLGMIDGNCLFVDGTKIKANASRDKIKDIKLWEKDLVKIDKKINKLFKKCDAVDKKEEKEDNLVDIHDEIKDQNKRKEKIEEILSKAKSEQLKRIHSTDPDCRLVKEKTGYQPGYNGQIVVDQKNGLIVQSDVIQSENDKNQFSDQIIQASENLEKKCDIACADAGYESVADLNIIHEMDVKVVVPTQKQVEKAPKSDLYSKERFVYDAKNDQYICPEGHALSVSQVKKDKKAIMYRMNSRETCRMCRQFGICTSSERGRNIHRSNHEVVKQELEAFYLSDEGQAIYKQRKEKVEHPFGHIKANLGFRSFLLRGLSKVKGEFSLVACGFNLTRMINISGGVKPMIEALQRV